MKTVLYYEFVRKKKNYIGNILLPAALFLCLFVVSGMIEYFFPMFNVQYMRWPDIVKNLLGLPAWNRSLYGNIWQIGALIFPVCWIYKVMTDLVSSVREEDRLETIFYLRNLSVSRTNIICAKGIFVLAEHFFACLLLWIENMIVFACLGAGQMVITVWQYYFTILLTGVLFMGIAVFILACKREERQCNEIIIWLLGSTLVISRFSALFQFISDLLVETERTGVVSDKLGMLADRTQILSVVSPIIWCWPSVKVDMGYVWCGIIVFLICFLTGFSIYVRESVIDDGI